MNKFKLFNKQLSSFQWIIIGFLGIILLGSCLLTLPISSQSGEWTPFLKALFTATSAVCVTGLIVVDTASHWSYFGQSIILLLIQIGGLGVVTIVTLLGLLSGRKISLMQRVTIQDSVSAFKIGGIVRYTIFILKITLTIEFLGAIIMMPTMVHDYGVQGIWMSIFHSISAFCNAGFDLLGTISAPFVSLTGYQSNGIINIVIMCLIVFGGLGFLVWDDILEYKFKFKKYRLQSKLVLITSACLIILPAIFFYFNEYSQLNFSSRVLSSLFQSVTTRTAGFNTTDLTKMSDVGQFMMIILMLIGGSPGSTAGGLKTTTFVVLLIVTIQTVLRKDEVECFQKRIDHNIIKTASSLFITYVFLFLTGSFLISMIDHVPLLTSMFEVASAVGTVGLTLGITSTLSPASHIILIILMFLGRIGPITMIFAATTKGSKTGSKYPVEKVTVG